MKKGNNLFYSLLFVFLFITSFVCVNVISSQSLQSYAKTAEYINITKTNSPLTPMVGGGGEVTQYTVSFDANGGEGTMSNQTFSSEVAQNLTLNNGSITKLGYLFNGWSTSQTGDAMYSDGQSFTTTGNVILYAVWILNEYTITFVANGGTQTSSITQAYNSTLELPTPTRDGYTFAGWYLDEDLTEVADLLVMGAGNITLYASWTKQESPSNITLYVILGVCLLAIATVLPIVIIKTRKKKQKPEQK